MGQITQEQYNTSKQNHRNLHIRVNLLDFDYRTLSSFEGNLTSGSLSSDANSNMRNTCDIELVVTDSSFNISAQGKIWLDRLIQIYVGVDDIRTGDTIWTNEGIYLINQPSYTYDAVTNVMSFQGVDLMGRLTGLRGGYLNERYLIPKDSNVREVIIAALEYNDFSAYVVNECQNVDGEIQAVPYDMEYDAEATWWDVLEGLMNILPNYQMYFDNDGVFHYEPVPYRANEPIRMTDDVWKQNVVSEQVSYDFESVKNSVKVLGATHTIEYFPSEQTISGNTLQLTIAGLSALNDGTMIGFTPPADMTGAIQIAVGSLGAKHLVDDKGAAITSLKKEEYYAAIYKTDKNGWLFIGHLQALGIFEDTNPDSPFYINNPAGKIAITLMGGDYENIQTDDLAYQRAKWEIYQRCRLNDTIQLTTVPIYWAEVNWMVSYTPLGQKVVKQYLIKSIQTDLSPDGQQTYELVNYYPYYE